MEHIQKLAISMGFSGIVECNITEATCRAKKFEEERKVCCTSTEQSGENKCENSTDWDSDDVDDDYAIVFKPDFDFVPYLMLYRKSFALS